MAPGDSSTAERPPGELVAVGGCYLCNLYQFISYVYHGISLYQCLSCR